MSGLIELTMKHNGAKVMLNPEQIVSIAPSIDGEGCVIADSKSAIGEDWIVKESYDNIRRAIDNAFMNPGIFTA